MPKFSDVPEVQPATEPVTFTTIKGVEVNALVRHLMAEQEGEILAAARIFAKTNGVENPRQDDPIYLLGLMVATVQIGVVDPDAPSEPFFDGGAPQIRRNLDRERIALLWARQGDFQDRMSGVAEPMGPDMVLQWALRIQAADPRDKTLFADLRPYQQHQLLMGLGHLVVSLSEIIKAMGETQAPAAPSPTEESSPSATPTAAPG